MKGKMDDKKRTKIDDFWRDWRKDRTNQQTELRSREMHVK